MVTMIPNTVVKVTDQSTAEKLMRLLSALDESDDVQQVYSNWEMSDEMLEKVTS